MIQVVNREPTAGQAGRVKLTLDDGTVLEGVLSMDDGASPEGTPWNAQTGRLLQADIRTYPAATAITAGDVVDISNGQATTDGTPSQGIALQTMQAGADVDVIFSGATYADFATQGMEVLSGGVCGYAPVDGVIMVTSQEQMSRYVNGTYTGNSTANRVIDLGARPKIVILFGQNDKNLYFYSYGQMIVSGDQSLYLGAGRDQDVRREFLRIVDNGFRVSYYSAWSGAAPPEVNTSGRAYFYTAIF